MASEYTLSPSGPFVVHLLTPAGVLAGKSIERSTGSATVATARLGWLPADKYPFRGERRADCDERVRCTHMFGPQASGPEGRYGHGAFRQESLVLCGESVHHLAFDIDCAHNRLAPTPDRENGLGSSGSESRQVPRVLADILHDDRETRH